MRIFGKSFKEYWQALKLYFILILVVTVGQTVLLYFDIEGTKTVDPSGLAKLFLIALAAWFAVKKYHFNLRQLFFTGFFLFPATVWATVAVWFTPGWGLSLAGFSLSQRAFVWIQLILINLLLYILVAFMGGSLAKILKKW